MDRALLPLAAGWDPVRYRFESQFIHGGQEG